MSDAATRPDPAADMVGSLRWLMDHVEAIERARDAERITCAEAARRLGLQQRYFHGKPWRVPDFGVNGYMHSVSDWRTWNARPEAERRAQWDALTMVERRSARGLVEAK